MYDTHTKLRLADDTKFKNELISTSRPTAQRYFSMLSASRKPTSYSVSKATPTTPAPRLQLPPAPLISGCNLENVRLDDDNTIGDGVFGSCTRMVFKDMFAVCVKQMKKDRVSIQALKSEASILFTLNNGGFTPHCFGVCLDLYAVIMLYICVGGQPISLFSLLYDNHSAISLASEQCTNMLVSLCKGVQYIHTSGFLHNDLKLDNVVIGNSFTGKLKPYIIDFGKACSLAKGKTYSLSDTEKAMYRKEHPQVAPDLRDGLVPQSESTDIYSLGRIVKRCNSVVLHSANLLSSIRCALSYHSRDRPDIEAILASLSTIISEC